MSIGINMFYNNDYFQLGILKFDCFTRALIPLKIFCLRKIKIKNVLMCIAYMRGELNISSTYRFMLSVSYIEELNISSLCDTRV